MCYTSLLMRMFLWELGLLGLMWTILMIEDFVVGLHLANDGQLSTMVAEQECQTLIENHDQIKLLSNARNNLNTTLKDVEGMMSISVEAAEVRDSLSDDKELISTYERLTALDGKRRFALAAASSHKEEVGKLSYSVLVVIFIIFISAWSISKMELAKLGQQQLNTRAYLLSME